jgi:hypothetical protein
MEMKLNHEVTKTRGKAVGSQIVRVNRVALRAFVPSWLILFSSSILASPTQQEVFKSIHENVGGTVDPKKFLAFMIAIGGLVILLAVMSNRRRREATPKAFNSQGKLLKEIVKNVDLRPAEIRQLKALAEAQGVSSPLTLLLCPSILTKAVKEGSVKVDRKVILGVAKKLDREVAS